MATITPSFALVKRLIPAIILEAVVVAACAVAYALTTEPLWFIGVGVAVVGFIGWTLYQVATHRDEWRWYDGTPGTGRKS
jgi:hypothetical protein